MKYAVIAIKYCRKVNAAKIMHVYNQRGASLYFICSSNTTYINFEKLGSVTNKVVSMCDKAEKKQTNLCFNIRVFWSLIVKDEEKAQKNPRINKKVIEK